MTKVKASIRRPQLQPMRYHHAGYNPYDDIYSADLSGLGRRTGFQGKVRQNLGQRAVPPFSAIFSFPESQDFCLSNQHSDVLVFLYISNVHMEKDQDRGLAIVARAIELPLSW